RLRLLALRPANSPGYERIGSPPGGSILSTSAPSSASSWVAYGPGRQIVRSSTRIPASSPFAADTGSVPPSGSRGGTAVVCPAAGERAEGGHDGGSGRRVARLPGRRGRSRVRA